MMRQMNVIKLLSSIKYVTHRVNAVNVLRELSEGYHILYTQIPDRIFNYSCLTD